MGNGYEVLKHELVPKHEKVSDEEVERVLEEYDIDVRQLPKLLSNDPVVKELDAAPGDVLRIVRESPTAGTAVAYRLVIEK